MSEQTKHPARGEMSADGKFYTHTDGTVHERITWPSDGWRMCPHCSFAKHGCDGGRVAPCSETSVFRRIEGAYVYSADEQAACDMARAMIVVCGALYSENYDHCGACNGCFRLEEKSCPARSYLAAHGDASAWEVK